MTDNISDNGDAVPRGDEQHDLDFSEGDDVLVRVREHTNAGGLRAKFIGECTKIDTFPTGRTSISIRLAGAGMPNTVSYAPYEAEFEPVEEIDEVSF